MSIGMIRKRKRQRELEVRELLYVCDVCGKEYKTQKGLEKHKETKHKDGE